MKKFLKWIKTGEASPDITIENDWLICGDFRVNVFSIDIFKKHENGYGEYLIGVIVSGRWYTIYRTESKELLEKNFEAFEKLMFLVTQTVEGAQA